MIVSINKNNYYINDNPEFKKFLKMLKDKNRKIFSIVGVEKNRVFVCRNDIFKTKAELVKSKNKWEKEGYKVHFTRG
ncbi:MAG: hypothetical protein ACTTIR_06075 [Eggerthia catenaformis]|uniref:hypothetical protein n=1 Tax=Eggerthia catenaformis TaxID=31973 RepID=UPI003FA02282